jgi:hypothetical protein
MPVRKIMDEIYWSETRASVGNTITPLGKKVTKFPVDTAMWVLLLYIPKCPTRLDRKQKKESRVTGIYLKKLSKNDYIIESGSTLLNCTEFLTPCSTYIEFLMFSGTRPWGISYLKKIKKEAGSSLAHLSAMWENMWPCNLTKGVFLFLLTLWLSLPQTHTRPPLIFLPH